MVDYVQECIDVFEKIDERINQIEQSNVYSGQVQNKQIYVTVQKVQFPQSMVFSEAELQEFAVPLIGKTVTIEEINKVVGILKNHGRDSELLFRLTARTSSMLAERLEKNFDGALSEIENILCKRKKRLHLMFCRDKG